MTQAAPQKLARLDFGPIQALEMMIQFPVPAEMATRRVRSQLARLQTSPQFAAVIDCLFDLPRRTEPAFAELAILDDRLLFARAVNEKTFRHFVGRRDQLTTNLLGFVGHLKLGIAEREYVLSRVDSIPRRESR